MKIGQLEIDLKELRGFIVKAKKNAYAGGGEEKRLPDGSKLLVFQEGDFYYEDNYAGSYQAPGRELVKWQKEDGQRIWQMSYSGGMHPKFLRDEELSHSTFEFLKDALMEVNSKSPFRGVNLYSGIDFIYKVKVKGDIQRFLGKEEIINRKSLITVFSQDFMGCLIMPK
jgi:hypothetical protein